MVLLQFHSKLVAPGLVQRCWAVDPLDRPEAVEILKALKEIEERGAALVHQTWCGFSWERIHQWFMGVFYETLWHRSLELLGNPWELGKLWRPQLVGGDWNTTFIFLYIGNVIIPLDFQIVQRGRSTTNKLIHGSIMTPYGIPPIYGDLGGWLIIVWFHQSHGWLEAMNHFK